MAAESEIKRKAELLVVEELAAALPDLTILPSRGGSDTADSAPVPLVFVVVEALTAEKRLAQEETYFVEMAAGYITPLYDVPIGEHAVNFKRLNDALKAIRQGWSVTQEMMLHGLDVTATESFEDTERRAHGDTISFAIGCTSGPVGG